MLKKLDDINTNTYYTDWGYEKTHKRINSVRRQDWKYKTI